MLTLVLLTSLLTALVSGQQANLTTANSPLDFCSPTLTAAADEDAILHQLESAPETMQSPAAAAVSVYCLPRCEDGPLRIIHTVPNEFHWPPIYRGSCDNLFCKDPPCIVRTKIWRTKCVFVFQKRHGRWQKIGFRNRHFIDHLSCGCKQCTDISDRQRCISTEPCPNSNNTDSFCYWNISRCACCKPLYCKSPRFFNNNTCQCECPRTVCCPPGQIFNSTTCECDCPPGSKKNSTGHCVGDCKDISERYCTFTYCRDNPHFRCQMENWKCKCPSCEAAAEPEWCSRTKCLEQRSKPHCVTDPYTNKCRCPRCEDQRDRAWCQKTYCGTNNSMRCRWEHACNRCFCPL